MTGRGPAAWLRIASGALAVAGAAAMTGVTGGAAAALALGWLAAAALAALAIRASGDVVTEVALGVAAPFLCVVLVWIGGLFMLPSALALLAAALADVPLPRCPCRSRRSA
ncbi:MAG: hypothetical protein AB7V42_06045 [Thermoleophilia bacterium]